MVVVRISLNEPKISRTGPDSIIGKFQEAARHIKYKLPRRKFNTVYFWNRVISCHAFNNNVRPTFVQPRFPGNNSVIAHLFTGKHNERNTFLTFLFRTILPLREGKLILRCFKCSFAEMPVRGKDIGIIIC